MIINNLIDWNYRINDLLPSVFNPVIGLALDETQVQKMINVLNTVSWFRSTLTTKEGPFLVIRSCKKLSGTQIVELRSIMYGVYMTLNH